MTSPAARLFAEDSLADDRSAGADDSGEALLQRLSRPPSAVAREASPWGFMAGLFGTVGLGLLVYLSLSAGRHARAQSVAPASPIPAYTVPAPAPPASPPPAPVFQTTPLPAPSSTSDADAQARLRAPAMVVDLSTPSTDTTSAPASIGQAVGPAAGRTADSGARLGSDERFAERAASAQVDTAHATRLVNTTLIAPQGTVISAVLETGINSDLPGFVRAVVSRDVSGFDGSTVLIPRGSKLIGEYKSGVAQGQSRAFVIWSRLLTPEGVSINLGSPATDREGQNGLSGKTDTHFIQRFGAAILLSVISAGLQGLADQNGNSVNAIVISSPQQASSVATVALQKDIDIPVTITIPMGQDIRVFVARDLDFSDVMAAR
jgi:type IV secretion system protein VirB10